MFSLPVTILRKEHLTRGKEQRVFVGKNALARETKRISPEPEVCLVDQQQPDDGG